VQYVTAWIAGVGLIISAIAESDFALNLHSLLIVQHAISIISPIFFQPCFFKWDRRVDREFKWIRIEFFQSCWWKIVQIVFCLLLTPGILGVQAIMTATLRNKPRIGSSRPIPVEKEGDENVEEVAPMDL
jgi:hypothetical protein